MSLHKEIVIMTSGDACSIEIPSIKRGKGCVSSGSARVSLAHELHGGSIGGSTVSVDIIIFLIPG